MQIRSCGMCGPRPECPKECPECFGRARMHRHGSYDRYRSPEGAEQTKVQRYQCSRCLRTWSVLENLLPYRALEVPLVEEHFDAQFCPGKDPPLHPPEKTREALRRAAGRLVQRAEYLEAMTGLLLHGTRTTLWQGLRDAFGDLESILLFLGRKINASLLGDYRCLRPWWECRSPRKARCFI